MRYAPALMLLAACSTVTGPAGPAGPQGEPGAAADASLVMSLMVRVAELEQRAAAAKVLWFVDGETREPIGRVLDFGDKIAWNDEIEAPVTAYAVATFYAATDCRGDAVVAGTTMRYVATPDGSIVEVQGGSPIVGAMSSMSPRRPCVNDAAQFNFQRIIPTGAHQAPTPPNRLAIEFR